MVTHDGAGTDGGAFADLDARKNHGTGTDGRVVTHVNQAGEMRTRAHVRSHP